MESALKETDWEARLAGFVFFVPTALVLGVARYLEPDDRGFGTHQQLGLGGCTFLEWTTLPCPMCGMTTTFSHMAHFQWGEAFQTQPFGVVLFLITISVCLIALSEMVRPKTVFPVFSRLFTAREGLWYVMLLIGMGSGWIYKIFSMKNWF